RRLAGTRRAHQRDIVAGADVEIDIHEHRNHLVPAHVVLRDIAQRDERGIAHFTAALTSASGVRSVPGFDTAFSPVFTPPSIAVSSPTLIPGVTGTTTARSLRMTNTTVLPSRVTIASLFTATRGFCSSGVTSRERNDTFALISGKTRGSIASKRT